MKTKYLYISKLHIFRAQHKLTQAQLGEHVGLTRQRICTIENDNSPTLLEAIRIAQYFGVSVEEIFMFEEIINEL